MSNINIKLFNPKQISTEILEYLNSTNFYESETADFKDNNLNTLPLKILIKRFLKLFENLKIKKNIKDIDEKEITRAITYLKAIIDKNYIDKNLKEKGIILKKLLYLKKNKTNYIETELIKRIDKNKKEYNNYNIDEKNIFIDNSNDDTLKKYDDIICNDCNEFNDKFFPSNQSPPSNPTPQSNPTLSTNPTLPSNQTPPINKTNPFLENNNNSFNQSKPTKQSDINPFNQSDINPFTKSN